MAKKNNLYFEDFITMVGFSCQAAELLQSSLKNFKPETSARQREAMHEIEHAEDSIKHTIMERLGKEFVPPIDREDIIQLSNELDDVTDKIEDILIRMDIYNVKEAHPAALDFADVIVRCCKTLQKAMLEFPNFQKSTTLRQAIINVNSMEEEGDRIYINAMRELYRTGGDPIYVSVWSKLFDGFEDCCDACEHVSDVMDIIIMKNS